MTVNWKQVLAGIIFGIILIIAIEIAVAMMLLNGAGITNPVGFFGSLITGGLSPQSLASATRVYNSSSSYVKVQNVSVTGLINVTNVNVSQNGKINGNLIYQAARAGFNASGGANTTYILAIPNSFPFDMKIEKIKSSTPGILLEGAYPQLPINVPPNGQENLTLFFRMPTQSYSGNLSVSFTAVLQKGGGN